MLGASTNGLGSSGLSPWHHIGDLKDPGSLVHPSVALGPPPPPPPGMMAAAAASVGGGGIVHGSSVRALHQGSVGMHPDCSGSGSGTAGTGNTGTQMTMNGTAGNVNNNNNSAVGQHHQHHHHHHQNSGEQLIAVNFQISSFILSFDFLRRSPELRGNLQNT
jgi:hypothetical protein